MNIDVSGIEDRMATEGINYNVAEKIRNELVCCDIYERLEMLRKQYGHSSEQHKKLKTSSDYHPICFYGEWAARIAERHEEVKSRAVE